MEPNLISIATILTSIATLVTAIAALFSVREIKAQRISNSMPDPIFSKTFYYTYWSKLNYSIPLYWSSKQVSKPDSELLKKNFEGLFNDVRVECFNVGYGVAKDVELVWDFDLEKFVEVLKDLDDKNIFKFSMSDSQFLEIESSKLDLKKFVRKETKSYLEFKFMLPVNSSKTQDFMRLPIMYIDIYSIYLYLLMNNISKRKIFDQTVIPKLKAEICYKDIDGHAYKGTFDVIFSFSYIKATVEGAEWGEATKVEIDFSEVQSF